MNKMNKKIFCIIKLYKIKNFLGPKKKKKKKKNYKKKKKKKKKKKTFIN